MAQATKRVRLPLMNRTACFLDRKKMKRGHPVRGVKLPPDFPPIALPIDWTKADSLQFPMDGNDQYGDCMYAAACHTDQTLTGNAGTESTFDAGSIVQAYLRLAGGDNGLDEGQIIDEWTKGLCGNSSAVIYDALDVDATNPKLMQACLYLFGGVFFMLDVPDRWVRIAATDAVWDVPARADQNNGHGVMWNGCDAKGRYKLQTWGTHLWLTPAGVSVCDPSAFVVFSPRWFNAEGIAPNGMNYDQLAALWVELGGATLPPNPFRPPVPPPSPPAPSPIPGGDVLHLVSSLAAGDYVLTPASSVPPAIEMQGERLTPGQLVALLLALQQFLSAIAGIVDPSSKAHDDRSAVPSAGTLPTGSPVT